MNLLTRITTITLILLFATYSVVTFTPVSAQSTFNPSVPSFTVKLIAHPYDVPPKTTTTVDQYTGQQSTYTQPGYHVENRSIEVTIRNQYFTPYTGSNGYDYRLLYNIHVKGHFGTTWNDFVSEISPSSSQYTIVTGPAEYQEGSQVDFRVEAVVGYYYDVLAGRPIQPLYEFVPAKSSGWSAIQSVTIGTPTPTTTETPTKPTFTATIPPYETNFPTQTDNNWALPQMDLTVLGFATLGIVVVVLLIFLVLLRKQIRVLELKQNGT